MKVTDVLLKAHCHFKLMFLATVLLVGVSSSHAKQLEVYCKNAWQVDQTCPSDRCLLDCAGALHFEGCAQTCKPKPCFQIAVDQCPEDVCEVVDGCDETRRCYPRMNRGKGLCGDLAYSGQDVECCPGLVRRCGIEFFDGSCDMKGENSVYGVPFCLPCGNGICNQFENSCNCPEDCPRAQDAIPYQKMFGIQEDGGGDESIDAEQAQGSDEQKI